MAANNDSDPKSCEDVVLANSPKLLKTTVNSSYTSLEVNISIKEPMVSFSTKRSTCGKLPSLLMTHDSSGAVGMTCNPFCEVPNVCQYVNATVQSYGGLINYHFLCRCTRPSCNELFLRLQPEFHRDVVEISHVSLKKNDLNDDREEPHPPPPHHSTPQPPSHSQPQAQHNILRQIVHTIFQSFG